jgi:hypothetical protein
VTVVVVLAREKVGLKTVKVCVIVVCVVLRRGVMVTVLGAVAAGLVTVTCEEVSVSVSVEVEVDVVVVAR